MKSEPLALMLYRRFLDGESVQQMAIGLSIPEERISQRIRAAAMFHEREKTRDTLVTLGAHLNQAGRGRPV